ncbi:Clan MP, family M67, Poh1-like metallopeptidase [Trichomonas vaginalis G3]|uniref:Clan MP, family M67, Poh1-like metallopeptidase n=1 Tax=Trichomonas vaginalis (strain ATCC PRA-98 / G3) TaxID=412133 RepID=A2E2W7_TRIV3|nr:metallopeptidase protein [Trichomonas vaginalis G3]EAY13022.1 Clan MP, family M67, Poh1-like metallopeptidase [Trichomonas vaginalis G3]KAI5503079.1 metallopeptidase protein [Trichomonas vaginalis G3]|eukprot:XP_001325245.1 Clan MP, family M67, Poh1-like metallopeptidase [Trichomonas vaginalis G3]
MTEESNDYSSTMPQGHFDTAETVQISGIALLKMLKNAQAGIPNEVYGLIVGRFIDDYTVSVVDVFPMPQNPTGGSAPVEDPYRNQMCSLLKKIARTEEVIGWYKSHPGTGVWLSGVDVNTQMQWEKSNQRCIAVVIDPVQSVKGKVVIGAFRCIAQYAYSNCEECRETTSFIGHLEKPTTKALVRNLNRQYYSMPVTYRMNIYEQQMLMSLNRQVWVNGFELPNFVKSDKKSIEQINLLTQISPDYRRSILDEEGMNESELLARHIGKVDPEAVIKEETTDLATKEYQCLIRIHHDMNSF